MNLFNRIVTTLLLVAGMIVLPIIFLFPNEAISMAMQNLSALNAGLSLVNPTARFIIGLVLAILSFIFCGLLAFLEITRPRPKAVRLRKTKGGEALLSLKSIASRLEYTLSQLPDVVKVSPVVTAGGKAVNITLNLETNPEINVPAKTEEVYETTRQVVEEKMGLKLGRLKINISYAAVPMPLPSSPAKLPPESEAALPDLQVGDS